MNARLLVLFTLTIAKASAGALHSPPRPSLIGTWHTHSIQLLASPPTHKPAKYESVKFTPSTVTYTRARRWSIQMLGGVFRQGKYTRQGKLLILHDNSGEVFQERILKLTAHQLVTITAPPKAVAGLGDIVITTRVR